MKQPCPLCDTPASYTISHEPYCKHFTCSTCIEFYIDQVAEDHIKTVPEAQRLGLSTQAAAAVVREEILVLRKSSEAEKKAQPRPLPLVTSDFIWRRVGRVK